MQEISRDKKRKVLETVAEMFGLAEELLLDGSSADNFGGSDALVERFCQLKEELREVRKGEKELNTEKKELEKSEQEAERTRDDALTTLQIEHEAANKERFKATKEVDVSEALRAGSTSSASA